MYVHCFRPFSLQIRFNCCLSAADSGFASLCVFKSNECPFETINVGDLWVASLWAYDLCRYIFDFGF
ncbi:hypothetical protein HanPI659440_Chr03g0128531 [Helianthus annuus]|nr:hypothetical protein HanPI659440_Chr03g0128531 [Helianthus annuus]